MRDWLARYLSPDDLMSVVGYVVFLVVSRLSRTPLSMATVSALISGMLAIMWLVSGNLRKRNEDRNPNARVMLWATITAVSIIVANT